MPPRRRHNRTAAALAAAVAAGWALCARPVVAVEATFAGGVAYANRPLAFLSDGAPLLPDPVLFYSTPAHWWPVGPYPTGGAEITVGRPRPPGEPDRLGSMPLFMDVSATLSRVRLDNPRGVSLLDTFPTRNAVLNTGTGLRIESTGGRVEPTSLSTAWFTGHAIRVPVAGAGPLTIVGDPATENPAPVTLARLNTFTGELRLATGGTLAVTEQFGEPLDDRRFGLGPRVAIDGGSLRIQRGSGSMPRLIGRALHVDPGGATLSVSGGAGGVAFDGAVTGTGLLRIERGRVEFRAGETLNTFSGLTRVDPAAALVIGGSLRQITQINAAGAVELPLNATATPIDRLGDAADLILRGGALTLGGGSSSANVESVGRVVVRDGAATLTALPGAFTGGPTTLAGATLQREPGGGAFFRGTALGQPGASAGGRFVFDNAASLLVGDGGAAGSTRQSILPWAWAASGSDVPALTGAGSGSFVTHDPVAGVRPLDASTEYVATAAAALPGDNLRVALSQSVPAGGRSVNALLLASPDSRPSGTPPTLSGGALRIQSGAILNTVSGASVFAPLDFNQREGVVIAASPPGSPGLALWGSIAGAAGFTKLGHGDLFLGGANTFTGGPVTLAGGRTVIADDVPAGAPSPLGAGPDPIVLVAPGSSPAVNGASTVPGAFATMLLSERAGATLTIDRPLIVRGPGTGSGGALVGGLVNGATVRLNAPVSVPERASSFGVVAGNAHFPGGMAGEGTFRLLNAATATFSTPNPLFHGEIELSPDATPTTLRVSANGALGDGRIFVTAGRPTLAAVGGGRSTIANPVGFGWTPATPENALRLEGPLTLAGPVDFGGIIGKHVVLAPSADVVFAGTLRAGGSLRLVVEQPGIATLTLSTGNATDTRTLLGPAADIPGPPATGRGILRVAHPGALGAGGVQQDAGGYTLQLDASSQPGGGMTLSGGGSLFLRGDGATPGLGALHNAAGQNQIDGPVALLADTTIAVALGSRLHLAGALADFTAPPHQPGVARLSLVAGAGGTLAVSRLARFDLDAHGYAADPALAEVNVAGAGVVSVAPAAGLPRESRTGVVRAMHIAPGAAVDLADAPLLIHPAEGASLSTPTVETVRLWIADGRLRSSDPTAGDGWAALAYGPASDWLTAFPGTLFGQSVDAGTVVVALAGVGDADLSGRTDLADFAALAAAFNRPGRWRQGDFNADGQVTVGDFAGLAAAFNRPVTGWDRPVASTSVPEPGVGVLVLTGICPILRRRRGGFR